MSILEYVMDIDSETFYEMKWRKFKKNHIAHKIYSNIVGTVVFCTVATAFLYSNYAIPAFILAPWAKRWVIEKYKMQKKQKIIYG